MREQEYDRRSSADNPVVFPYILSIILFFTSGISCRLGHRSLAMLALLREREVIHRALLHRNGVFPCEKWHGAELGKGFFADRATK